MEGWGKAAGLTARNAIEHLATTNNSTPVYFPTSPRLSSEASIANSMRLINIATMRMEEFCGSDIPDYLILSHTWARDEVSFRDYIWLQTHDEELADGVIDELTPGQKRRVLA